MRSLFFPATSSSLSSFSLRRGGNHNEKDDKKKEQQEEQQQRSNRRQRQLLQDYNRRFPKDMNRTRKFVESIRLLPQQQNYYQPTTNTTTTHDDDVGFPPYDIYNCPLEPPPDTIYPATWNILDVLQNWNPNNDTIPNKIYQGLCVFDFERDWNTAERYRKKEVPFVLVNTPDVWQTTERWNRNIDNDYLLQLFGGGGGNSDDDDDEEMSKVEHSSNRHFMYWKENTRGGGGRRGGHPSVKIPRGWKPPTDIMELTYRQWLEKATTTTKNDNATRDWYYFRYKAEWKNGGYHSFLYDELPFFRPTSSSSSSFFIVDPSEERGINCRFGMAGILAEAHYDSARNFIVLLKGSRRYILAHPRECRHLELYPMGHPSARHSSVDWTANFSSSTAERNAHPLFALAQVNEVVLQAGDVLYLPTHWFHFIQNLDLNYQCNARSGTTHEYMEYIQACGFPG